MNYTVQELKDLLEDAKLAAYTAGIEHLDKYGEHAYCGFAWVDVAVTRTNSQLAKA